MNRLDGITSLLLKSELRRLMAKVQEAIPYEAPTADENYVINKFRNGVSEDFKNVIGLNVTQRLLGIFNRLNVKVHFSTKPERKFLRNFLKRFHFVGFKRITRLTNTFAAQVRSIVDYDELCSNNKIFCGAAKITITPCYKFTQCPPTIVSSFGTPYTEESNEGNDMDDDGWMDDADITMESNKSNASDNSTSKEDFKDNQDRDANINASISTEKSLAAKSNTVITKEATTKVTQSVKPSSVNAKVVDNSAETKQVPQSNPNVYQEAASKPPNSQTSAAQLKADQTKTTSAPSMSNQATPKTTGVPAKAPTTPTPIKKTMPSTTNNPTPSKPLGASVKTPTTSTPIKKAVPCATNNQATDKPLSATVKTPTTPTTATVKTTTSATPINKATTTTNNQQTPKPQGATVKTPTTPTPVKEATPSTANNQPTAKPGAPVKPTPPKAANNTPTPKPNTQTVPPKPTVNTTPVKSTSEPSAALPKSTSNQTVPKQTVAKSPAKVQATGSKPSTAPTTPKAAVKQAPAKPIQRNVQGTSKIAAKPAAVTGAKNTPVTKPKPVSKTEAKNSKTYMDMDDFEELDDHDILALMSQGIVLDECSGSEED